VNRPIDEHSALTMLVETSARQLSLPKNRAKGALSAVAFEDAVRGIQDECDEVLHAFRSGSRADVLRELGDVGAWTAIAVWLAVRGQR
jgi:NTP pyrophosphatase (non-canonical NTP hydrolase)